MMVARGLALLATATLVVALAPSAGARTDEPLGGIRQDPVGDVQPLGTEPVTQDDLDRVDLVAARWSVSPGRRVSVRMELVDIAPGDRQAQYQLKARQGRTGAAFLTATRHRVLVNLAEADRPCRGSRSTIDAERDVVRFSFPVRCLPEDRYTFAPLAFLIDDEVGEVAYDRVDRSRRISIR